MWERVPSRDVLCQDSQSEHGGSSHVEDTPNLYGLPMWERLQSRDVLPAYAVPGSVKRKTPLMASARGVSSGLTSPRARSLSAG